MAKVSICIPTYNNAAEVKQLLDSIAIQTYRDYEVIITDDSTDNMTEALIQTYPAMPIRYTHNLIKLGHIYNWNAAIAQAKGAYIKIMFSDDWFTGADSLAVYVSLLEEHPEAAFAFSGSMQVSDHSAYARQIPQTFITLLQQDYRHLFLGNQIGAPSGTIYRNHGERFDEHSNWASDLFLYFEILSHNSKFAYSEEPLVSIGLHGEQYTHMFEERDDRIFHDYYALYRKYSLQENPLCKRFFMDEYIMRYGKGWRIARSSGFKIGEYLCIRAAYLWQNKVVDYWNQAKKLIHR
ncbi:MAG: glycosyltransferase [Lachnospiraceae bacterium]